MITYPFNVNDQQGNAARIVYHKLGIRGDRLKDSPAVIRNHVEQATKEPQFNENLAKMRRQIEKYENHNLVAEAVNRIIRDAEEAS